MDIERLAGRYIVFTLDSDLITDYRKVDRDCISYDEEDNMLSIFKDNDTLEISLNGFTVEEGEEAGYPFIEWNKGTTSIRLTTT